MKQQIIKLSKIVENKGQIEGLPRNPRQIKDEKYKLLKKSIEDDPEMLELRELLVYPHNNKFVVIGGNMRLKVLRELGVAECPCKVIPAETPIEKLRAYTIKDNNSFGEYDFDLLGNDWEVDELLDWGCDLPDITIEEEEPTAKEDNYTEEDAEQAEPRVARGEIWQLGEHRLMCGDSTDGGDVALLMNGVKVDMVFTDPPYGINIVNTNKVEGDKPFGSKGQVGYSNVAKAKEYSPVIGDATTDTAKKAYEVLKNFASKMIIWGGNYFVNFLDFSDGWIIWDKRGDMNSNNFADGEMAWCSFHTPVRIYKQIWYGMIREGEREQRVHPTQKPVKMISDVLSDFTKQDEKIIDLFGGSGSTLIACEQLKRKCYMMELDPHYCDVIIDRWERLTGKTAVKVEQQ